MDTVLNRTPKQGDLLQEAPYFFASRVKADSDYEVNHAKKKKDYVGEPLAKF